VCCYPHLKKGAYPPLRETGHHRQPVMLVHPNLGARPGQGCLVARRVRVPSPNRNGFMRIPR
jgi:hypothetical protein